MAPFFSCLLYREAHHGAMPGIRRSESEAVFIRLNGY